MKELYVVALSANNWETGTFRVLDSTSPSMVDVKSQSEISFDNLLVHIYWQPDMPIEHEQWDETIKEVVQQYLNS